MPQFCVWETEYPDEGSNIYDAIDAAGAISQWMAETKTSTIDAPDLSVCIVTPAILEMRAAADALEDAQRRFQVALETVEAESQSTGSER